MYCVGIGEFKDYEYREEKHILYGLPAKSDVITG